MTDDVCPECGAAPAGERNCQELLHELLERTYGDEAAYGLAASCYALQHPAQQSDRALVWAEFLLTQAVRHGLPLEEARRAARARFDQRRYRATAPCWRHALEGIAWRMTIAQLAALTGSNAERLLLWARTILQDLEASNPTRPSTPHRGSRP